MGYSQALERSFGIVFVLQLPMSARNWCFFSPLILFSLLLFLMENAPYRDFLLWKVYPFLSDE